MSSARPGNEGIELDRFTRAGDGVFHLPALILGLGEIDVDFRLHRIEAQSVLQVIDGLGKLVIFKIAAAESSLYDGAIPGVVGIVAFQLADSALRHEAVKLVAFCRPGDFRSA